MIAIFCEISGVSFTLTHQWLLLRKLCSHNSRWTLEELATDFEVHQRTIRRDLSELSNVGFPLKEQVESHGLKSCSCETACLLAGLSLTFEEATSLSLCRRYLEHSYPVVGTGVSIRLTGSRISSIFPASERWQSGRMRIIANDVSP